MALNSGQSSMNAMNAMPQIPCGRCGSAINGAANILDPFIIYCQACAALTSQESMSQQKKIEQLTSQNNNLKMKQDTFDMEIAKHKARAESIEKAYNDESNDRLAMRADRDWARNALLFWKSFLDHQKVSKTCPYCSKFESCPALKEIETQAMSATPQWKCAGCEEREAGTAVMERAVREIMEFMKHEGACNKCGHVACDFGKDLFRSAQRLASNALLDGGGSRLLARLASSMNDFSFLGENTAILYSKGKYQVVKVDPKKIMTGDVVLLSSSNTPKNAVDLARRQQEITATDHVTQNVG